MELSDGVKSATEVAGEEPSCTNCVHMSVCGMAARLNAHLQGFASAGLVRAGKKAEMQESMNGFEVSVTAAQARCYEQYRFHKELGVG